MPMCVGVNGQCCSGDKSGFPVEVRGQTVLLCRVCYAVVRPGEDNARISLSDTLTVTPARLTMGLNDTVSSPTIGQNSQPLFDTQMDEEIDIADGPAASRTADKSDGSDINARITAQANSVVVNELLCYCFNMLNCMAQSLLQKVCAEYYDEAIIEAAKEEIIVHNMNEAIKTRLMKKRRGSDKKSTIMKDILDAIRSNDPDVFPIYVAKSLGNLPPLSRNCVNMASIMVELAQLRSDVND